ncbi:MAG: rRNA maturation RNase YbeY [Ferruginibacter sp.]
MAIHFHFEKNHPLHQRRNLKRMLAAVFTEEGFLVGDIRFIFCSDEYLLSINNRFLKHNFYTDIVTFDYSEPGSGFKDSELYISVDRVIENASFHKVLVDNEMYRVLIHGILHLCGFGDKTDIQKSKMKKTENYYLSKLFNV